MKIIEKETIGHMHILKKINFLGNHKCSFSKHWHIHTLNVFFFFGVNQKELVSFQKQNAEFTDKMFNKSN